LDGKELRELIDLIAKSNFVTFELERDGFKLKLDKGSGSPPSLPVAAQPAAAPPAAAGSAQPAAAVAAPSETSAARAAAPHADNGGLVEMTSPIVGTFYRQPSVGAPPFVEPGSRVRKGQTLCIIEAMKLMNEIEAEIDAEVVEIVVANGQPVEFGELLFRLRPLAS
jgi:acetyl-CoA carboxylase biotin carboxyl carrier protein